MIGVICDTNIYGKIFDDEDGAELVKRIKTDSSLAIHNFRLIRNELRNAPRLLPLYDELVSKRVIDETKQITDLARAYFKEYKANRGVQGQKKILNDFKIMACATLLNCDLVFSDDMRTLFHPIAVKAYREVNLKLGRRTPTLFTYADLKKRFLY